MDISRLAQLLKDSASDYSQLANAYPNLKNFAGALVGNVERNVPTQAELQNPEAMQQRALGYMSPMAGAIKAYHGTPHKFERFDMSKIGTGEGAQAYGHGLYFAENPKVAEEYRDALSGVEVGGKVLKPDWDDPNYYPLQALRKHGDDIEKARQDVYERNARIPGGWPEELEAFESLAKQGIQRNQGNLYNVSLEWPDAAREAADPLSEHHLLDWDKPISEQSDYVKNILSEYMLANPKMTGQQAWKSAINKVGDPSYRFSPQIGQLFSTPEAASARLNEIGIPGIKYLDQGSRAGGGTSNYVMFGDEYPQIVNRASTLAELLRGK